MAPDSLVREYAEPGWIRRFAVYRPILFLFAFVCMEVYEYVDFSCGFVYIYIVRYDDRVYMYMDNCRDSSAFGCRL
jgi:hypothetical protein